MMRHKALIALIYFASTSYAPQSGLCLNGIEEAKLLVKEQERKRLQPFYPEALMRLANEYYMHGQTRLAEVTFRKALWVCKTRNPHASLGLKPSDLGSESYHSRVSSFILTWAESLAYGRLTSKEIQSNSKFHFDFSAPISREDRNRIDLTVQESLREIDKVPTLSLRTDSYIRAAKLFRKTGALAEENKCKKFLLSVCEACENNKGATEHELISTAWIFYELATLILPVLPPDEIPIEVITVSDAAVNGGYTEIAFRQSEKLRLRATALFDRLPSDHVSRIHAHRSLALWYMKFGKTESANIQRGILSKLIGSKDNGTLFPLRTHGCGNGRFCGMG